MAKLFSFLSILVILMGKWIFLWRITKISFNNEYSVFLLWSNYNFQWFLLLWNLIFVFQTTLSASIHASNIIGKEVFAKMGSVDASNFSQNFSFFLHVLFFSMMFLNSSSLFFLNNQVEIWISLQIYVHFFICCFQWK